MQLRTYRDPSPPKAGRQGGSIRWSIPVQPRRDLELQDGQRPEEYAVIEDGSVLVVAFDDIDLESVLAEALRSELAAVSSD